MKRLLTFALALMMALGCAAASLAAAVPPTDTPFFQLGHFDPADVDVSDVREENGRLVGVIHVKGQADGLYRIDCPVPMGFTAEQQVKLTVDYKKITTEQLKAALQKLGQDTSKGQIWDYADDTQNNVDYTLDELLGGEESATAGGKSKDDPAFAVEYEQVRTFAKELAASFGAELSVDWLNVNRYDAEHVIRGCPDYSMNETFTENNRESFRKKQKYFDLTMAYGMFELLGLPVTDQYYWIDGKDSMGASSSLMVTLSDDGVVYHTQINSIPEVAASKPITLPDWDRQTLVQQCVASMSLNYGIAEDTQVKDKTWGEYTRYASHVVITEISPCWVGKEQGTLVPGWCCTSEERVTRNDEVIFTRTDYGDAETLLTLGR